MPLYVGQKVVCIDDKPVPGFVYSRELKKGNIYTIREVNCEVRYGQLLPFYTEPHLRLVEIVRKFTQPIPDMPWLARRFRPLTDISVFDQLLKTTKPKVPVDAL